MSEAKSRAELVAAFVNRAMTYWHVFDELRTELGEERAVAIMKRAIYRRGVDLAPHYAGFAPGRVKACGEAFVAGLPDGGSLFAPDVRRCDDGGVDIKFGRCPLKEAWQAAGVGDRDLETLCAIAGRIDNGIFETAGFKLDSETWKPGDAGCCFLHIRPGA